MPRTRLSMPRSCGVAVSPDVAWNQGVSCSQYAQTAITANSIGTQCALAPLISTGSQTEAESSVLEGNNTQVGDLGASKKFTAHDGADTLAQPKPRTSTCDQHSGKTRSKKLELEEGSSALSVSSPSSSSSSSLLLLLLEPSSQGGSNKHRLCNAQHAATMSLAL
ncbi:uncharacterized protein LOC144158691 isoform X2 [Haemaphysalis longicornis]